MRRLLLFGMLLASGAFAAKPAVIVIFGDLHGDESSAEELFSALEPLAPTHALSLGDLSSDTTSALPWLGGFVRMFQRRTGISQANTFFLPGNWEEYFQGSPALTLLRAHGNLVVGDWKAAATVKIGETQIFASHAPQYQLPQHLLPPEEFLDAETVALMQRMKRIPPKAVFAAYAHTHVSGAYLDRHTGKFVINPGPLTREFKSEHQHRRFAVYREASRTLEFHDLDAPNRVEWMAMDIDAGNCPQLLEALGKHPVLVTPEYF